MLFSLLTTKVTTAGALAVRASGPERVPPVATDFGGCTMVEIDGRSLGTAGGSVLGGEVSSWFTALPWDSYTPSERAVAVAAAKAAVVSIRAAVVSGGAPTARSGARAVSGYQQIADLVGVSRKTVSRILNHARLPRRLRPPTCGTGTKRRKPHFASEEEALAWWAEVQRWRNGVRRASRLSTGSNLDPFVTAHG